MAAGRALLKIASGDDTVPKYVRDELKRYIAAYEAKKGPPKVRSMSHETFRDTCTGYFVQLLMQADPEEAVRHGITPESFPYRTLWYPPDDALLPNPLK
jgi:hypothetical protein